MKEPLRSSLLRQAILNPELCYEMVHNGYEIEQTPSMAFGTLAHLAILQPRLFEKSFVIKEPRKGKEFDKVDSLTFGKAFLLLQSTVDKLRAMQNAMFNKTNITELIGGTIEGQWITDVEDLHCIARPDIYNNDIIIDYKTVSHLKDNWLWASSNAGYNIQFAHYHQVLEALQFSPKKWIHIVQETCVPYRVRIYKFTHNYMCQSFAIWEEAITVFKTILDKTYDIHTCKEEVIDVKSYLDDIENTAIFGEYYE